MTKPTTKMPRYMWVCCAVVILGASAFVKSGEAQKSTLSRMENSGDTKIEILPVQGNVYMLAGGGANITLQVGDDGILLVDTGLASLSDQTLEAIERLNGKPIRYIINTSDDPDHAGGNAKLAKVGNTIAGGNVVGNIGDTAGNQATVIAFQTLLDRMSAPTGKEPAMPEAGWPEDTYTTARKNLWFNDEGVRIIHQPAGHTDGDSMVIFRRSDVVSTGDIFVSNGYPIIDPKRGGSIQGVIDGLNRLIYDIILPGTVQGGPTNEGGTMVVPGHGRICDYADVVFYQEMVTIVRDRVQDMIKKGMTLEQVKAAKPTMDYDSVYGHGPSASAPDAFVENVYTGLKDKQQQKN